MNGQNQHCHIMCNPLYLAFFTTQVRDRQAVIDVLRNGQERRFLLNAEAVSYLNNVQLSAAVRQRLTQLVRDQILDEAIMQDLLSAHQSDLGPQQRKRIIDAAAVAAYHAEVEFPDDLFSTRTGYNALDDRLAKTKAKKDYLLMLLEHPEIPLHNNPVELETRRRAWDTFQTLAAITKKLGLSFLDYIHDRVSKANQIPALNCLIYE